jgi:hypothetical protein
VEGQWRGPAEYVLKRGAKETVMADKMELRLWTRVTVTVLLVGGMLIAAKWMPLPGLDMAAYGDFVRTCSSGNSISFIGLMFACPEPMLMHKELGASALLGSVAILAFVVMRLRRCFSN